MLFGLPQEIMLQLHFPFLKYFLIIYLYYYRYCNLALILYRSYLHFLLMLFNVFLHVSYQPLTNIGATY